MIRRVVATGLIALCMAGSIGAAKADDAASAKKAIQSQYAKSAAAAEKKDLKGMMAHLAPDYEETGPDGVTVKVDALKSNMQRIVQNVKSIRIAVAISKLTLKGDKATVLSKETMSMVVTNPQTKKDMKFAMQGTSEEQWEKKSGVWLEKRAKTLATKQFLDGKELPQPGKQPKKG